MSARTVFGVLLVGSLVGALGCATGPPQSGFLSDYSGFEPVPPDAPLWEVFQPAGDSLGRPEVRLWRSVSSSTDPADFDRVMIDDIAVILPPGTEQRVTDQSIEELRRDARNALVAHLCDRYPLADRAGPGVLRLRLALTDVQPTYSFRQRHSIGARVINSLPGGISLEGEAVDAESGVRVFALIAVVHASRWDVLRDEDQWAAARMSVERLGRLTRRWMDEAHESADQE